MNFDQKQKLANSYGFHFYLFGCNVTTDIINGTDFYNKRIVDHLESKYGKGWWTKFQTQLDSIDNENLTYLTIDKVIDLVKTSLDKVSKARSMMGAAMNRLEHVVDNLTNVSMNSSASRSQIQDADYATASTALAKSPSRGGLRARSSAAQDLHCSMPVPARPCSGSPQDWSVCWGEALAMTGRTASSCAKAAD